MLQYFIYQSKVKKNQKTIIVQVRHQGFHLTALSYWSSQVSFLGLLLKKKGQAMH